MKNNHKKAFAVLGLSLAIHSNSWGVFGVGDIVSDPGSYAYYAEQIASATEQVSALTEQLEQVKSLVNLQKLTEKGVTSMAGDMIGIYNNAIDFVDATDELIETSVELPTELENQFYKELGDSEDTLKGFERMEKFLDSKYNDPLSADFDPIRFAFFRSEIEKTAADTLLKSAAQRLSETAPRIETLADLAAKIDDTENIKDAADLNNRFNGEILLVLTEINDTFQQLAQLEAFGKLKGGKSDIAAESLNGNKEPNRGLPEAFTKRAEEAIKKNPKLKDLPF